MRSCKYKQSQICFTLFYLQLFLVISVRELILPFCDNFRVWEAQELLTEEEEGGRRKREGEGGSAPLFQFPSLPSPLLLPSANYLSKYP